MRNRVHWCQAQWDEGDERVERTRGRNVRVRIRTRPRERR
jgi:hypothetical protein